MPFDPDGAGCGAEAHVDTTFLLPVLDEVFAAFGRGVMRGVSQELANPTAPLASAPTAMPLRTVAARRTNTPRPAPAGLSSAPDVGATVGYRQGRGSFEATVVSVDTERSTATVRRSTDGREVVRPFSKLFATGSSNDSSAQQRSEPVAVQDADEAPTTGD